MEVPSPHGTRALWAAIGLGLGLAVTLWCAQALVGRLGTAATSFSGSASGSVLMPAAPGARASRAASAPDLPVGRPSVSARTAVLPRASRDGAHRHAAVRTRRPVAARPRRAPRAVSAPAPSAVTSAPAVAPAPAPAPPATIQHRGRGNVGPPPGQAKKTGTPAAGPSGAPGQLKAPGPPAVPPGQAKKADPGAGAQARGVIRTG